VNAIACHDELYIDPEKHRFRFFIRRCERSKVRLPYGNLPSALYYRQALHFVWSGLLPVGFSSDMEIGPHH